MNDGEDEQQHHIQRYLRDGCRSSAEALLSPYQQPLFNYLLGTLRHRQDAEDALQETFLKALRGLPRYEHRGHFKAWLFQIAHNVAYSEFRSQGRAPPRADESELENQAGTVRGPSDELAGRESVAAIEQALAELPAAQREVVLLRLRSGLTFREIAEALDIPLNTALGRMHQAKANLRHLLDE